ncbi:type II toxin-antitoxin system RelE/ParE family toxin [Oxalobacteraceae bacterium]|nr:type II toxin-antitoxin system RelE/ParE family toxin [Oxalobacteraceae bacterium]
MARLIYSRQALDDLERISDFLVTYDPAIASAAIELIIEAVTVLERHPLIGRAFDEDLRELVITQGKTGYVALYSFEEPHDAVLILAVRHQREAGFHSSIK